MDWAVKAVRTPVATKTGVSCATTRPQLSSKDMLMLFEATKERMEIALLSKYITERDLPEDNLVHTFRTWPAWRRRLAAALQDVVAKQEQLKY